MPRRSLPDRRDLLRHRLVRPSLLRRRGQPRPERPLQPRSRHHEGKNHPLREHGDAGPPRRRACRRDSERQIPAPLPRWRLELPAVPSRRRSLRRLPSRPPRSRLHPHLQPDVHAPVPFPPLRPPLLRARRVGNRDELAETRHEAATMNRIIKLIIVIAILYFVWKVGLPWLQRQQSGRTATTSASAQSGCPAAAARASETWGSGLHQFVNPPYDISAWSSFHDSVESKISAAEGECSCSDQSCDKARAAMRDLRSLLSDLDTAIRNGSAPPSDLAQRREAIDKQIDEAADLTRAGK